jgi:hypothetical protein
VDSFESRLRLALAQDRADYATAPGMEARVRGVSRRRATQRRVVAAAALATVAIVGWLPLRTALQAPAVREAPEAIRSDVAEGEWPTDWPPEADAPSRADGTATAPTIERGTPPGTDGPDRPSPSTPSGGKQVAKQPSRAGEGDHPPFPVVKMKTPRKQGMDLVPITTPTASAVASVMALDANEPEASLGVATVLCAVDGPEELQVGETGTWTATAPGANDARWVDDTTATVPYSHTFAEPATYEIVLDVAYDELATMQCHRNVTVEPDPEPPVTPDPDPPATPGPDPTAIDTSGEPSTEPNEISIQDAEPDATTPDPTP